MSLTNINKIRSERGFTIVELLIVIVVIAILAAITIVAYNGVTSRANATSAQAAASTVIKKGEAYNAELTAYPTFPNQMVNAASSNSYALSGVSFTTGASAPTTAPTSPNTVIFYACSNPSGAGLRVAYWDYSATTPAWTNITTGGTCTTWTYKASGATS